MDQDTRVRLADEITGHLRAGTLPLAEGVMANPVDVYTDPAHLAAERDRLFRRHPRVVAFSDQVRRAGDFVTDELSGEPVLVVRGEDGTLRAFYNVCRHRGAAVESAPCGNQRRFTCPYHAWTYDTTGALRGVPDSEGFPDLDAERRALAPLQVTERHGFVWLLPEGWGEDDLATSLGGLDRELGAYGLGDYVLERTEVLRQPFNWKLIVDGFLEAYHLQFLHRTTIGPYIRSNFTPTEGFGDNLRMVAVRRSFDGEVDKAPEDVELLANVAIIYLLFPNTVLVWQGDHFECWTVHPDGDDPGAVVMRASLLAPAPVKTEDEQLHWDRNWKVLMDTVLNEDFVVARTMQRGFSTGAQEHVLFGRNEPALQLYHRRLAGALELSGRGA